MDVYEEGELVTDMLYAPCNYGGEDACFDGQSHIFVAGDGENAIAMCDGRPLGTVADIEQWKWKAERFDVTAEVLGRDDWVVTTSEQLAKAEAYDKAERVLLDPDECVSRECCIHNELPQVEGVFRLVWVCEIGDTDE